MFYTISNLSSQRIVSGICGVGAILFCESEYSCLRLFTRKTTLFFFMTQLAIWTSMLEMAVSALIYFLSNLQLVQMFILVSILKFAVNVSYPIMMLLRLKLIRNFTIYIMFIALILACVSIALKYFWIHSALSGGKDCFHVYYIIQPITTIAIAVQNIIINLFFIVMATKHFQNIVHIRCTIIVNIIVIIVECIVVVIEFLIGRQCSIPNIIMTVISISDQIKIRLEIEILSYIVKSVSERRERFINNEENIRNNLDLLEERCN